MIPGLYNISSEDYHADKGPPVPSLAAGIADSLVNQTPLHAWTRHRRLNPNYIDDSDPKFDTGTAAHALLLEGLDHMVIVPFDDWRTKAAKEQRDLARAEGKIAVLPHQGNKVQKMVEAAKKAWAKCEDLAGYQLEDGKSEQSMFWEETYISQQDTVDLPIWLRCRPDWLSADRRIMLDAKFTDTDVSPEAFSNQIIRMAYDLRASFYLRGNQALGGDPEAKYLFLVQEARPPYATCFIGMSPAYVALGNEKVETAIAIWRQCMTSGKWPGYPARIHWAEPPTWALSQWEEKQYTETVQTQLRGISQDMIDIINTP